MKKRNDKVLLAAIERIRAKNNKLWMEILAIALKECPGRVTKILREISFNDRLVTARVEDIARAREKK